MYSPFIFFFFLFTGKLTVVKSSGEMPSMSCAFLARGLIRDNGAGRDFYAALGKPLLLLKMG